MMELKYKKRPEDLIGGLVCIIVACVFMIAFLYICLCVIGFDSDLFPVLLLSAVAGLLSCAALAFAGLASFKLHLRAYVTLYPDHLMIRKSMVIKPVVQSQAIESTMIVGSRLSLVMLNEQCNDEKTINLELLYAKDIDLLLQWLADHNVTVNKL